MDWKVILVITAMYRYATICNAMRTNAISKIRPCSVNAVIYQRAKTGAVAPFRSAHPCREGVVHGRHCSRDRTILHESYAENTQNRPESQYPKVLSNPATVLGAGYDE